ncbi:heat shock 70 kDa protein 12A-like [Saccostrea cucullata]|uniref:heat shock 70 kDa protein 12A-like n=1 Tax=Saccostrea cuccullata TaxID=36930 RepID=UPI002ED3D1BC
MDQGDQFNLSDSDSDAEEVIEFDNKTSVCERQIVAAIDFGTIYSSYAYSFKFDWTTIITQSWHDNEYLMDYKTPTSLLLKPDGSFFKFGFEAENEYARLSEDDNHKDHYFFRRFMLILKSKLTERVHRKTVCIDETGKEFNALQIFTYCIQYLKDCMLERMNIQVTGEIKVSDIDFVITVPAIWDDTAKMLMIAAAQMAGIQKEQLKIALESEAASIYCQYMHLKWDRGPNKAGFKDKLTTGFKYMVIDLGNNTADISVYERAPDGGLKQVIVPSEISWGETNVDDAFLQFFCDLIGKESMDTFKEECMEDYLDLFKNFGFLKRSVPSATSDSIKIRIPAPLSEILDDKEVMAKAIESSKYKDIIPFKKRADIFKFPYSELENFFKETCDNIKSHLDGLLKKPELADVETVLLVGGFSECYIIQEMIKKEMKDKHLILPQDPGLAVLKGAVYFGHVPNAFTTHISNYSYGVQNWPDFDPSKHPEEKKIRVGNQDRCRDVFMKFVTKGDKIKPGHRTYYILKVIKPDEDIIQCSIYLSRKPDPKFIDEKGVSCVGSLQIKLPKVDKGTSIDIEEKIFIKDTEVEVIVTELHKFREFKATFDLLSPDILKEE